MCRISIACSAGDSVTRLQGSGCRLAENHNVSPFAATQVKSAGNVAGTAIGFDTPRLQRYSAAPTRCSLRSMRFLVELERTRKSTFPEMDLYLCSASQLSIHSYCLLARLFQP